MKLANSHGALWLLVVTLCALQVYSMFSSSDARVNTPEVVASDTSELENRVRRLEADLANFVRAQQPASPVRRVVVPQEAPLPVDHLQALDQRVSQLEARTAPRTEDDPERRRALVQLFEAIRNGDLSTLTTMLANVDLNSADDAGNTPLIVAASSGNAEMIEALVAQGANLELRGARGLTPLLAALESDQDAVADLLLDRGSNPRVRDKNGENALIWAAHSGSVRAVSRLLTAGLDVNAKSFDGNTAIADAVRLGHVDIIRLLARNGANLNVRNRRGESVLDLAKQAGNEDITKLLVSLGAQ